MDELIKEAKIVKVDSVKYWMLRARYLEKYVDPTYGEKERANCYQLWNILRKRNQH